MILYSSVPPTSPRRTIYLTSGFFSILSILSIKTDPTNLSPPIATPSAIPSAFIAMIFESSLKSPPERVTNPQEPARCSLEFTMFSIVPPMLAILNAPGAIAPTVAGPITVTPAFLAVLFIFLASLSGIPSAVTMIELKPPSSIASIVTSYAVLNDPKLRRTSAFACSFFAAAVLL